MLHRLTSVWHLQLDQAAHLAGEPEHLPQARPARILRGLQPALPVPPARLLLSNLRFMQDRCPGGQECKVTTRQSSCVRLCRC